MAEGPEEVFEEGADRPLTIDSPTQAGGQVGGRLMNFWESWIAIGAEASVIRIVKEGLRLEFVEKPKLTTTPVFMKLPIDRGKREATLEQLRLMVEKNVIEEVENPNTPGFYNRFFLVPKKQTGKWKTILDMRILNEIIVKSKFKMETAESIKVSMKQGYWMTSIDFTDAYFHIGINQSYRRFL